MSTVAEYYIIRISRKAPHGRSGMARDVYIGDDNTPVKLHKAKRFASLAAAEEYVRHQGDTQSLEYLIQFCASMARDPQQTSQITEQLMEIPYPYRRTAYNWMRGVDVEALLRGESDEVYERHKKFLRQYDMDIGKPSDIILISGKRKPRPKPHYDALPKNAPRQFVPTPQQRPSFKKT